MDSSIEIRCLLTVLYIYIENSKNYVEVHLFNENYEILLHNQIHAINL